MSVAPRHTSNWFAQHYDKLSLFVMLLALLGSTLLLIVQLWQERMLLKLSALDAPAARIKTVPPANVKTYDDLQATFQQSLQNTQAASRLMVSAVRVSCISCGKPILYDSTACPFCGAAQPEIIPTGKVDSDSDTLPDVYEVKYGLNPFSAEDALGDPDGDGFTNIEEFQADTSPSDASESPPIIAKLRLNRVTANPFKLRFQAVSKMPDGGFKFQINLRSLDRTLFVQIGDTVEGFEVKEYIEGIPPADPILLLRQNDKDIRLPKGKAYVQQEFVADLVLLTDRTRMQVRIGEVFKIKDVEYKVIDIKRDSVLIRNMATGKEDVVNRISQAEVDTIQGSAAGSKAAPTGAVMPGFTF